MAILVGKPAPDFNVQAVKDGQIIDNFTLSQFKGKKHVVLFFYPNDFTFVCPTELHEFQSQLDAFKVIGCEVIAASVDSPHVHLAWLRQPKTEGGIQGITYPILSDLTKAVSASYDVLLPEGVALRGTFIIDREGIVQSQLINNLPLGRSVIETLRLVRAVQFTEKHGEVCPADWNEGSKGFKPDQEGLRKHFGK